MDHILQEIFKIILIIYIIKKYEAVADNSPIRIHVNKIENMMTFKINPRHYLEILTSETMKLFGSTKTK